MLDCDGQAGNGCECSGTACCAAGCQITHANGIGQSFYDCVALGTHNLNQAKEACLAYTGNASLCVLGNCTGGGQNLVVCSNSPTANCWNYSGSNIGHVHVGSLNCPSSADPTWN